MSTNTRSLDLAKRYLFDHIWSTGVPLVAIAPRAPGVIIPDYLKEDGLVILRIATDLLPKCEPNVDDSGIVVVLSFNQKPFAVSFPWSAVQGIADDVAPATNMTAVLAPPYIVAEAVDMPVDPAPVPALAPSRPKLSLVPLEEDPT